MIYADFEFYQNMRFHTLSVMMNYGANSLLKICLRCGQRFFPTNFFSQISSDRKNNLNIDINAYKKIQEKVSKGVSETLCSRKTREL